MPVADIKDRRIKPTRRAGFAALWVLASALQAIAATAQVPVAEQPVNDVLPAGTAQAKAELADREPGWLAIRSIDDSTLESLVAESSPASRQTQIRALLTIAERNLNRSMPLVRSNLSKALTKLTPNTDEAAFATALRCQVDQREQRTRSSSACSSLELLGFVVANPIIQAHVLQTRARTLTSQGKQKEARQLVEESNQLAK